MIIETKTPLELFNCYVHKWYTEIPENQQENWDKEWKEDTSVPKWLWIQAEARRIEYEEQKQKVWKCLNSIRNENV